MSKNSVCGTLIDSNTMEREMMECFRALDPDGQDFVLHIASVRRRNFEEMMKETGLDKDAAGTRYDEWVRSKVDELLYPTA